MTVVVTRAFRNPTVPSVPHPFQRCEDLLDTHRTPSALPSGAAPLTQLPPDRYSASRSAEIRQVPPSFGRTPGSVLALAIRFAFEVEILNTRATSSIFSTACVFMLRRYEGEYAVTKLIRARNSDSFDRRPEGNGCFNLYLDANPLGQ